MKKTYGSTVKPKSIIFVRKHLDNSITAWYGNDKLSIVKLAKRPAPDKKVHHLLSPVTRQNNKQSHWYQSNSFIYEPKEKIKEHNALRKRI